MAMRWSAKPIKLVQIQYGPPFCHYFSVCCNILLGGKWFETVCARAHRRNWKYFITEVNSWSIWNEEEHCYKSYLKCHSEKSFLYKIFSKDYKEQKEIHEKSQTS